MKPETLGRDAVSITLVAIMVTLVLAFISIPVTSAEVTELNVDPQVVDPGDIISITGNATPWEEVWISSSFELPLYVEDGEYSREFNGIHFIGGRKDFSVTAENIKNIQVSLSRAVLGQPVTITCSGQIMTFSCLGQTKTSPINDINETRAVSISFSTPIEIAGFSKDISGEKDIHISGEAAEGATSVDLKVAMTLKSRVEYTPLSNYIPLADSNGDFPIDINTKGVPEGEFLISARGMDGEKIEKTVYIGVTPTPTPSPSPSPTPTPTETSTSSDTSTPSPSPSPSPSTSPSPTPTATAMPTTTLAPTATPAVTSPTPAPATPSPSPSPTPSQRWIPGFEAVFAIAGLLAVAYLALRKRRK